MKLHLHFARFMMGAFALTVGLASLCAQSPAIGTHFPLYAADYNNCQILKIKSDGTYTVLSSGNLISPHISPPGEEIALDANGNLFISLPPQIIKVDSAGNQSVFFDGTSLEALPFGLAFDSEGNLWATAPTQSETNNVLEIGSVGTVKKSLTVPCFTPLTLAFDTSESNLYVTCADAAIGGITSSTIKVPVSGATPTTTVSGPPLFFPYASAFDNHGNLFIADLSSGILEESGGSVTTDPLGSNLAYGALAFGPGGSLYAAPVGEGILSFDSLGQVTRLASLPNSYIVGMAFSRGYTFSGFLAPISNPPAVNSGHPGRTFPVKFQLQDSSGANVSALSAVASVTYANVACATLTSDPMISVTAATSGASGLHYDSTANQYVYNWSAPSQAGCYDLTLTLDSGQVFSAYFNLK